MVVDVVERRVVEGYLYVFECSDWWEVIVSDKSVDELFRSLKADGEEYEYTSEYIWLPAFLPSKLRKYGTMLRDIFEKLNTRKVKITIEITE